MRNLLESGDCVLPSQVRSDLANRLKETKKVRSLELLMKGESLEDAKEFSRTLVALKKRGVRISHELTIKLDFPRGTSRERILSIVENMPRSKNGFLKARVELADTAAAAAGAGGGSHEN